MSLDTELESMEEMGQTQAEEIDEETEIQDVEDDVDEIEGPDAEESDLEHTYGSFITDNEADYDGYDPDEVIEEEREDEEADVLNSEGYHIEDAHDLEEEVIEMELEEGDIYAIIVDEDDNEIGFVLLDENGNEQEYYYVDMDEYEFVEEEDDEPVHVVRASDDEEFDLGITREGVAEATVDMNAIYKEGSAVLSELKDTMDEINEGMSFLKKK